MTPAALNFYIFSQITAGKPLPVGVPVVATTLGVREPYASLLESYNKENTSPGSCQAIFTVTHKTWSLLDQVRDKRLCLAIIEHDILKDWINGCWGKAACNKTLDFTEGSCYGKALMCLIVNSARRYGDSNEIG